MNVQELGLVNILSKCLFILKSCLDDKYLSLWWDTGSRQRREFRRCTGNILLIAVIKQWLSGLCLVMSKGALDNHEINLFVKVASDEMSNKVRLERQAVKVGWQSFWCLLSLSSFWLFLGGTLTKICCRWSWSFNMSWLPAHPQDKKRHLSPNEPTSYHLWVPRKCRTRCLS